jgi:hypothetical protein
MAMSADVAIVLFHGPSHYWLPGCRSFLQPYAVAAVAAVSQPRRVNRPAGTSPHCCYFVDHGIAAEAAVAEIGVDTGALGFAAAAGTTLQADYIPATQALFLVRYDRSRLSAAAAAAAAVVEV